MPLFVIIGLDRPAGGGEQRAHDNHDAGGLDP
jgi:hypothetical protein